jgi:hypothetical protein
MSSQSFESKGSVPALPITTEDPTELQLPVRESLSAEQLAELQDSERQAEFQRQFLIQQSRRACPGCGDW